MSSDAEREAMDPFAARAGGLRTIAFAAAENNTGIFRRASRQVHSGHRRDFEGAYAAAHFA